MPLQDLSTILDSAKKTSNLKNPQELGLPDSTKWYNKPGFLTPDLQQMGSIGNIAQTAIDLVNPTKIGERLTGAKEMVQGSIQRAGERLGRGMESLKGITEPESGKFSPQAALGLLGGAGEIAATPITAITGLFKPEIKETFDKASQMIPEPVKQEVSHALTSVLDKMPEEIKNVYSDAFAGLGLYSIPADIAIAKNVYSAGKSAIDTIWKGISQAAGKASGAVSSTGDFITKQVTGLSDDTINLLKKEPVLYKAARSGEISRTSVADDVVKALDDKIDDLGATGSQYETIRKSPEIIKVPKVDNILTKKGIGIKGDQLDFSGSNIILESDKNAIQKAYNEIKALGNSTNANSVLNLRSKLDDLVGWDSKVTSKGETIVKSLRSQVDDAAKTSIPTLKETDAAYSTLVQEMKKLKKDFFNVDGTLKDNALSKIVNLTGKGKEQILTRLEEASPGITDKIRAIAALENVTLSSGQQVGHYVKGALLGGTAASGNPAGFIAGAIVSNPKIAAEAIMTYGKIVGAGEKMLSGMVSKIKSGIPFTLPEAQAMSKIIDSMSTAIGVGVGVTKGIESTVNPEDNRTKTIDTDILASISNILIPTAKASPKIPSKITPEQIQQVYDMVEKLSEPIKAEIKKWVDILLKSEPLKKENKNEKPHSTGWLEYEASGLPPEKNPYKW